MGEQATNGFQRAITRRQLVRGAAAVAAVGLGGAALSGCGTTAAKTTAQHYKIILTFQPNGPTTTTGIEIYQKALEPWYKANKGVEVKLVPVQWRANVDQILSGTAADVIWDNYAPAYMSASGNLLLPLDNLIKQDGLDVANWSSSQINSYRTAAPNHGLYMLPNYFSPLAYVVRLSDYDDLGVERPNPNWTAAEFVTACRQVTGPLKTGVNRRGAVLYWYSNAMNDAQWPFYGWTGGHGIVTSAGLCDLSTTSALSAGEWIYEQLLWPGYAWTSDLMNPNPYPNAQINDEVTIQLVWGDLPLIHAQTYHGFVWDYYLPPAFENGPTCEGTDDFFGIPANSKHPEQAWSLLKFISYDASATGWQRQNMQISLIQPCLNSLWDVWISTLQTVAPPLATKNLEIFKTMAMNGRAFPEEYYPVGDVQIQSVPDAEMSLLYNQQTSVAAAWKSIEAQINATLKPLIKAATLEQKATQSIATVTPGATTNYAAPTVSGAGAASVSVPNYMVGSASSGTWTILGAGADITDTEDDLIFACASETATEGTWTCQLTSIANVSEDYGGTPTLSNWTRAGLMARGDLSDNAAFVALFATGSYGFNFLMRPAPGANLVEVKFLFWKGSGGVVQEFISPINQPTSNYIIRPMWIRLERKGTVWTPSASSDGTNFTALTGPQTATALGGAWVGLAASAHNQDFNDVGYFRATFDHLQGFTPTQVAAIGQLGLPPAGGTVPSAWATQPSLGSTGQAKSSSSSSSSSASAG